MFRFCIFEKKKMQTNHCQEFKGFHTLQYKRKYKDRRKMSKPSALSIKLTTRVVLQRGKNNLKITPSRRQRDNLNTLPKAKRKQEKQAKNRFVINFKKKSIKRREKALLY